MPYSRLKSIADFGFLKVATRILAEYCPSRVSMLQGDPSLLPPRMEESTRLRILKRREPVIVGDSQNGDYTPAPRYISRRSSRLRPRAHRRSSARKRPRAPCGRPGGAPTIRREARG